jgi:dihydrofolate synthase/folylpolyglutamate synthase
VVQSRSAGVWSALEAEDWLLGLEQFGMRFGLDRMGRLMTALGAPHERFRAVHVVGTNGKSSTTRMTAAILERHGIRTGAYLSPHLVSFNERILVGGVELDEDTFARACARVKAVADVLDAAAQADDQVTQFEALTAVAFSELAEQGVEVAVIEAGLGGRLDATNVLAAEVVVLTNVALEHTKLLGSTVDAIAREKLAVVKPTQPPPTLIVGAGLDPAAATEAEATAQRQGARLVHATADAGVPLLAQGDFQRLNFAMARAAAEAIAGPLDERLVRAAAAETLVPGRFQVVSEHPAVVLDGAHNADGIGALAASLPGWLEGRRLVIVVSVLDDKDAASMLAALLPLGDELVVTSNANPRAVPAQDLAALAGRATHVEADPRRALTLAKSLAGEHGVVLATGSIYLIADLLRPPGRRGATI